MEITLNLKTISAIVAVIAVIIGIIEGLNVFSLSGLVSDFVFYGSLAIIIAILGLLGVYISKMDIRIAAIHNYWTWSFYNYWLLWRNWLCYICCCWCFSNC
jgi:uncharacterized membrane protein YgaE (UPF0421/DUF939 family)